MAHLEDGLLRASARAALNEQLLVATEADVQKLQQEASETEACCSELRRERVEAQRGADFASATSRETLRLSDTFWREAELLEQRCTQLEADSEEFEALYASSSEGVMEARRQAGALRIRNCEMRFALEEVTEEGLELLQRRDALQRACASEDDACRARALHLSGKAAEWQAELDVFENDVQRRAFQAQPPEGWRECVADWQEGSRRPATHRHRRAWR